MHSFPIDQQLKEMMNSENLLTLQFVCILCVSRPGLDKYFLNLKKLLLLICLSFKLSEILTTRFLLVMEYIFHCGILTFSTTGDQKVHLSFVLELSIISPDLHQ